MGVIIPNPTVATEDNATSVANVKKIEVSNGTLTDDGSRIVSISTGGSGAAGDTYDVQFNNAGSLAAGSLQFQDGSAQLTLGRSIAGNTTDIIGGKNPDDEGVDIQLRALADDGSAWSTFILAGEKGGDGGTQGAYLLTVDGEGLLLETGIIQSNKAASDIMLDAKSGVVNVYSASETPVLQISDDSNRVDLECVANKKLRIRGGAGGNTFDFDVSSASGGITFPDSTTQTTAASGGGGLTSTPTVPLQVPTVGGSDLRQWPLFPQFGTSQTNTNGILSYNLTTACYLPFYAPATGDIQSISIKSAQANDDDIYACVYDSDSNQMPQDQIGTAATWDMGSTGVLTLDVSAVADAWNVTAGSLYYLGLCMKSESGGLGSPNLYVYDADDGGSHGFMIPRNNTTTEDYAIKNEMFKESSLSGTLPATATPANMTGVGTPFNRLPIAGVVI